MPNHDCMDIQLISDMDHDKYQMKKLKATAD